MLITPANTPHQDWEIRADFDGARRVSSHRLEDGGVVLLYFDLDRTIERPVHIYSAELVFGVLGPPGVAGELVVGTILTDWLRGPLSWTKPWAGPGMVVDADFEPPRRTAVVTNEDGSITPVKVNVTRDLRRWFSGQLPNLGWRITGDLVIGAARNVIQASQPTLSVKYSEGGAAAIGADLSMGAC